eukprot:gnl/MRDRNA2_/MRDRNA2_108389_c0_seq1.p1 gnl/MRDRNA2_/MRDRNA2_108389_c0~~gnl/MRDRNA2_/MRDRNA2_108389_c0_seq1.p1  ORF type:complete len:497 (-),score=160.08 gnl/MRDRNA2_/MRDRNA2_108389_c0_seq1:14-1504(-)
MQSAIALKFVAFATEGWTAQAWKPSYTGEQVCEGHSYTQEECVAMKLCCTWTENTCWSAIGQEICPHYELKASMKQNTGTSAPPKQAKPKTKAKTSRGTAASKAAAEAASDAQYVATSLQEQRAEAKEAAKMAQRSAELAKEKAKEAAAAREAATQWEALRKEREGVPQTPEQAAQEAERGEMLKRAADVAEEAAQTAERKAEKAAVKVKQEKEAVKTVQAAAEEATAAATESARAARAGDEARAAGNEALQAASEATGEAAVAAEKAGIEALNAADQADLAAEEAATEAVEAAEEATGDAAIDASTAGTSAKRAAGAAVEAGETAAAASEAAQDAEETIAIAASEAGEGQPSFKYTGPAGQPMTPDEKLAVARRFSLLRKLRTAAIIVMKVLLALGAMNLVFYAAPPLVKAPLWGAWAAAMRWLAVAVAKFRYRRITSALKQGKGQKARESGFHRWLTSIEAKLAERSRIASEKQLYAKEGFPKRQRRTPKVPVF